MATKTLSAGVTDQQLRDTVNEIDRLSQIALDEISNLADLAVLALNDATAGVGGARPVAAALRSISDKAQRLQNDINVEAESVGCNYTDDQPLSV